MVHHKPSPRVALSRWLAQIHYNAVRQIETSFPHTNVAKENQRPKPLRGFQIADDLVLTRKRTFFRIAGTRAIPVSIEEVAANYNLEAMQKMYRAATDEWKNTQRNLRRRQA